MRITWFLCLLLIMPILGHAQPPGPLAKVKIDRGFTLKVPNNMRPMSQEEIQNKYLSNKPPIAMYTTADTEVDFGIKVSNSSFLDRDLALAGEFYKANLSTLYDSVNFLREEIEEINGRQYLVFEFVSVVAAEEDQLSAVFERRDNAPVQKFTYVQYTVFEGQLMVFNFSCPQSVLNGWRATAWDIMHSIKIK